MARKMITKIVGDIINLMDKTIRVSSFTQTDTEVTLYYCSDLKWLVIGDKLCAVEDCTKYIEVVEITDEFIRGTKSGPFPWTNKTPHIDTDFCYLYGSRTTADGEWLIKSNDERQKLPLIYFVRPTEETTPEEGAGLDRTSELLLYFCDTIEKYNTATDVIDNVIPRIWGFVSEFERVIKESTDFANIGSIKTRELHKLGTETANGIKREIFDSDLAAIEFRTQLPIRLGAQICKC